MNLHAVDAVVELYRLMDDDDRAKVKKHLKEDLLAEAKEEQIDTRSICEIQGHKFKRGPRKLRFILPPQEVSFCERCGKKIKL